MALSKDHEQDSLGKINLALKAFEKGDTAGSLALANEALNLNCDDGRALFIAGQALHKAGRAGLAYNIFRRVIQLEPSRSEAWNMAGICLEKMWKVDEAERCFREALKRNPANAAAIENMSLIAINRCQPDEALKWISIAERSGIKSWENTENKAMALLMKRDWSGWELYRQTSGMSKPRTARAYNNPEEPMWSGEKGSVVVYGNQGIGDEIAFASCIPDACEQADIIIDCSQRVAGLFRRSFPKAKVYGTRFADSRDWDHPIDYSIPVDCLPSIFRAKGEFPGKPYLKADPERRVQWRALFDTCRKPVIGIAWTGGGNHTGRHKRSLTLEEMLPLFKSVDATWVSLEYRDVSEELEEFEVKHGIKILDYPRATRAPNLEVGEELYQMMSEFTDYDETAALVSELDLVVSVTTSVVHLSGALGKECFCLVPNRPRWFYGTEGDRLPWYGNTVKLFRQEKDGRWPIEEITKMLRLRYGNLDVRRTTNGGIQLAR